MASGKNENIKTANRLLNAYWIYSVLKKGSIMAATLSVLQIKGRSLKKDLSERYGNVKDGGSAKGGGKAVRAAAKANAGARKNRIPLLLLAYLLKKERLF